MKFRNSLIITALLLAFTTKAIAQDEKTDYRLGKSMEILLNVFKEANLYYVDSVNPDKMLRDAANAMLQGLDPYTVYLPSSDMEEFETMTTGRYAGVGALIRQNNGWVEISEPYKNTPADRAGLKAGDRVLAIDATDLRGATSEKVSSMLRGEPGTSFKLRYRPIADTLSEKEVTIKREQIVQPSITYCGYLKDGIGYLRLDGFIEDGSVEMRDAIQNLRKHGELKGLIIDLRDNSGGVVAEAVKMLSLFVPKGTEVVSLRGKIKELDTRYVTKTAPIEPDLPLVILQSSASASASEIMSGALQDLDRAVVLGQRSFGKGLVQTPKPVGFDSYLKVTTAKYYIPSGRSIQALDYANRKEDGSVGHIPDSLIKEYKTLSGRKVYSGGGVQPDVKTEKEYYSKFTAILLGYGFIDDFANLYAAHNKPVDVNEFVISDEDYEKFIEYMKDKEITYESGTAIMLKEMKKWAEREKFDERLKDEFASIERKIKEDKIAEMRTFKDEIKAVLAENIMTRWYYSEGSIKYALKSDKDAQKAAEILTDMAEYKRITTEQDTEKK